MNRPEGERRRWTKQRQGRAIDAALEKTDAELAEELDRAVEAEEIASLLCWLSAPRSPKEVVERVVAYRTFWSSTVKP